MAEILRMDSDDPADVEQIWTTFVPSASVLRIDPADFAFRWRSVTFSDLSIVRYSLTAEVRLHGPGYDAPAWHDTCKRGRD